MEGVILVHFTSKGETVNRFPYVWPNERSSKRRFSSGEEVIGMVQNLLKTQPIFFSDGFKELMKRWNRCGEVEGDYVEKWR
jgi:hypothetical protein